MSHTTEINKEFYDGLYRQRNRFVSLLHATLSYDQQSKSKDNVAFIRPLLRKAHAEGRTLHILDIGFGHGSFLLKLPARHTLSGCEISEEAVRGFPRVAALLGKQVRTFRVDELDAELARRRFDIITLSHVLEHVDDDRGLLTRLVRSLSPDGHVLVNLPINEVWADPKHVRTYTPESIRSLFLACGLQVEHMESMARTVAFFLVNEQVEQPGLVTRLFLKLLRLFLALAPRAFNRWLDGWFDPARYADQHIIALGSKASA